MGSFRLSVPLHAMKKVPTQVRRPTQTTRSRKGRTDGVVDFLEAAYRMDGDDTSWMRGIAEAAVRVWNGSSVAGVSLYDASDVANFKLMQLQTHNLPEEAKAVLAQFVDHFTPAYVARTFRSTLVSTGRAYAPELRPCFDALRQFGFSDCLSVNGLDPNGQGVHLGLMTREPIGELKDHATYRRMAHHLGAAYRCRRRLRESASPHDPLRSAEAIVDERGRLVHAEGPATSKAARNGLLEAVRSRARVLSGQADTAIAVELWHPLTHARWTLVDSFAVAGHRYVVARENQSRLTGLEALSDRERQVVAYAALGHSTKEAAYALGIAPSTARVLLARAAAKLGAKSRRELHAHPALESLSGAPPRQRRPRGEG